MARFSRFGWLRFWVAGQYRIGVAISAHVKYLVSRARILMEPLVKRAKTQTEINLARCTTERTRLAIA